MIFPSHRLLALRKMGGVLERRIESWLLKEQPAPQTPLCDFDRLSYELRPGDVVLVEGRSRIGNVIKLITQSPWTHSALYVGRLFDIRDANVRARLTRHYHGSVQDQLMVEAILGQGTIVTPLENYKADHLRICRPRGLSGVDAQHVINYAISRLGTDYDTRQLLDLARFMFPYSFLPRRWRSSLFEHNAGTSTRTVCSTMLAEAFGRVDFPILPFIHKDKKGRLTLYKKNPKLLSPRDFDYSPYFDIIKYPYLGLEELSAYQNLPWEQEVICDDEADCFRHAQERNGIAPENKVYDTWVNSWLDEFKQRVGMETHEAKKTANTDNDTHSEDHNHKVES